MGIKKRIAGTLGTLGLAFAMSGLAMAGVFFLLSITVNAEVKRQLPCHLLCHSRGMAYHSTTDKGCYCDSTLKYYPLKERDDGR